MSVTSALNQEGADGKVTVRLSEVDPELRMQVADRLETAWVKAGVQGLELLKLRIAARNAIPDAELDVPIWKARRVLLDGKLPRGSTPTFVDRPRP